MNISTDTEKAIDKTQYLVILKKSQQTELLKPGKGHP